MAIALARIDMTKPTLISGKSWKARCGFGALLDALFQVPESKFQLLITKFPFVK